MSCPNHTCIIKARMNYAKDKHTLFNKSLYNRLLDECGDSDIMSGNNFKVDPAMNFFHNIPLIMNTNERIEEKLANGTPCRGLYLKLRGGCQLKKENWEGRIVNTIYADEFDYIVCMHENISEGNIF